VQSPPAISSRLFPALSQAIIDTLLHKAASSTIHPLVSAVAASLHVLSHLYSSWRFGGARRLIFLLESHLQLIQLVLNYKQQMSPQNMKPSLLEQALCSRTTSGAGFSGKHYILNYIMKQAAKLLKGILYHYKDMKNYPMEEQKKWEEACKDEMKSINQRKKCMDFGRLSARSKTHQMPLGIHKEIG